MPMVAHGGSTVGNRPLNAVGAPPTRWERLDSIGVTREVLLVCLLWLVAFGPIVQPLFHAGAPRMALTDALVANRDVKIDGYLVGGIDFAERDGHIYSDKAVGQELLAVPIYLAALAVGAEAASVQRVEENLTTWWTTFWSAGVPLVAIVLMVSVACARRGERIPTPALVGLTFGTLVLPYSVTLYGHLLGAALGFAAWLVLDGDDRPHGRAWMAGALVGLATLVEYQVAIVALVLAAVLVLARRWTDVIRFAVAGLPSAVILLVYQAIAFGSPFESGYDQKEVHEQATLLITGLPSFRTAWSFLFGSRGMFIFTPIVAVGLVGLISRWRSRREVGVGASIAVCVGFMLLQAGWVNPWGGEAPGPRYLIPMLPFLGLGLADVWTRVPGPIRRVVLTVSMTSMVLATVTEHLMGDGSIVIIDHLGRLLREGPEPTLFTMVAGPLGWLVHLALVGAVVRALLLSARSTEGRTLVVAAGGADGNDA